MVRVINQPNIFKHIYIIIKNIGTKKIISIFFSIVIVVGSLVTFAQLRNRQDIRQHASYGAQGVYSGVYIKDAQRNIANLISFETSAQKGMAILNWYQGWGVTDGTQNFQQTWMNTVRSHGSIPLITWEPWDYTKGTNQSAYSLKNITRGDFDTYITKWAQDSKNWGYPYFLRFAHEMNSTAYPWSEATNGNSTGDYVLAWRHVHDIFNSVGAINVTWVWSPNVSGPIPITQLYPGDAYVDWLGMDGYNGGTALSWGGWLSFSQIFNQTYQNLVSISALKPIIVAEVASTESGGSKASWVNDTYQSQIPLNFSQIHAVVWFNQNNSWETDWRIESSITSQNAFTTSLGSPIYASNTFSNLNISPIAPPIIAASATPTSTPTLTVPSPSPDTIAPTISITFPFNGGSVLAKSKINITASASDNIGVARVEFFVNNTLICTDTAAPYACSWSVPVGKNKAYTLSARATDAQGNYSPIDKIVINSK